MKRNLRTGLAVLLALLIALQMVVSVSASPPAPGDTPSAVNLNESAPAARTNVKPIDQPNLKDWQRNQARMRLLESGRTEAADQLALTADDKVLVILVEFAGTDSFTWNPGDEWDPYGRADESEAVYDADGNVIVGDCSNIITQTQTFSYTGPLHNEIPRPLSADDRSGDSIWTEDFNSSWFNDFVFGDGVIFDYARQDGSPVYEDFTGMSVRNFYLDMSGGDYDIEGDIVGWLQLPHSTWYYASDECPGARSGGGDWAGAIPGAGDNRQLVRDAVDAVNAAFPSFDWAQYDRDGDGVIDRLWLVHSGYGEEDSPILTNRTDYGEGAMWSHSGAVSPPYPVAPGVAVGPYIVMPENGGLAVFAHEYGHNLGAMDLYDTDDWAETSAGFWTLMADSWTGYPIGFQAQAVDPMHLDWWGWLDPMTISDPSQVYTLKLGQASEFPGGEGVYRAAKIELPDGVSPLAAPVWQGDYYWWGGQEDLANGMMTTAAPVAIPAGGATLSFDLAFDIEAEWDFLWVQASTDGQSWTTLTNANMICTHDSAWIGGLYGFPDDLCAAGIAGFSGHNAEFPDPAAQTLDLGAFAGQNVWLRFWYMTDWGTLGAGSFVDNVKVMEGATTLFSDDAEGGDAYWTYAAPWQRNDGSLTYTQNFYVQWRNVGETGGYDSSLGESRWRYGPANTGLVVWYNNNFYADNKLWNHLADDPGFGAKGRMLVVDANSDPFRDPAVVAAGYPNSIANLTSRSQMRDATFSQWNGVDFTYGSTGYAGRPAKPAFHDSMGYYPGGEFAPGGPVGQTSPRWMATAWDASVVVPATSSYGVKAPGYNGTDRWRFNCSLNALGQTLCYSYATGLGYAGGSGNPGDDLAQYGWHVEILDQTDSVATVKVWNSMYQFDGSVAQAGSTNPVVVGTYVDVDVMATNVGGAVADGLLLVPVDPDAMYVPGSAYGGAMPLTAEFAGELAQKRGLTELAARAANAAPDDVVAVAWSGAVATGEEIDFGFTAKVTAMSGELQHDVAVYDGATFINAIAGSPLTIVDNSTYAFNRSRRFNVDRDTYVDGNRPGTFFGDNQLMWVGFYNQMRPVVHTRLDGIPTDAAVDTAYLYVYVYEGRGFADWPTSVIDNVQASPVTTSWMPDATNWWTPWTVPGGDFGMAGPSNHLGSGKIGTWLRLDVTAAAEDMLRSGFNQGFMLTSDDNHGVRYGFATKENWIGYVGYMRVYFRTAN